MAINPVIKHKQNYLDPIVEEEKINSPLIRNLSEWFEKFSESPRNVSASATRFPCNNHASFMREHVKHQCYCCSRLVVVMTLSYYCRVLIFENGKKLRFEQ